MKKLFQLFFLVILSVSFLTEFASEAAPHSSSLACFNFYQIKLKKHHRVWRDSGTTAIGDDDEPKYKPKGRVVEIDRNVEASNQCQTYECYLFAAINFINVLNRIRFGDHSELISEPYLVAHKFLEHIKDGLRYGPEDPRVIHDLEGGFAYEAFFLSRTVGLIPKTSWKPTVPFPDWNMANIYRVLKKKVPEHHEKLKKLAKSYGWDAQRVKQGEQDSFDELKNVILKFSGPLPTEVNFNGKSYTPLTWEEHFGIPRLSTLDIINKDGNFLPDNYPDVLRKTMTDLGGHFRVIDGNFNSIIMNLKKYIDQEMPVIVDLNWKREGHSMLVVGYELDDDNNIVRFKVMNSWGRVFANNGFAWYTVDDLWKNITGTYHFSK